jgi:hypothetical protein
MLGLIDSVRAIAMSSSSAGLASQTEGVVATIFLEFQRITRRCTVAPKNECASGGE